MNSKMVSMLALQKGYVFTIEFHKKWGFDSFRRKNIFQWNIIWRHITTSNIFWRRDQSKFEFIWRKVHLGEKYTNGKWAGYL